MMLDDLPIWGYVGELETKSIDADHRAHYYLFTHLDFSIAANGPNVIEVNVSADPLQRVDLGASSNEIEFSYSVRWMNSSVPHGDRMNRYAQYSFLPQAFEIHWLSIINSFVLVLLLTGFLSIILMRVLKNDFTRYASAEEEEEEEETGWKLLHGDVFRLPPKVSVFCAWVGIGVQLFALVLFLLILAIMNIFYPGNRGAMYTAAIVLYALTAGFAGFVSAHLYCRLIGTEIGRWAFNLVLSGTLFPVPLFLMFSFLNTVAIAYNSQTALPIGTILVIICIWALITLPLTVIGGILGRNLAKGKDMCVPCRTSRIPREIPPIPWYRQGPCQVFMAGFLPFSAIYIELHYIFASVWGHKLYTLYGVLFIAFGMLIVVTSFITVALTYFQLAIEDHRWWWRSFFSGGSTGFFLFAYCFFYYFERSAMFGFMQTSFFFGYMLLAAYAAFLMLGTIGFMSSLCFVLRIYRAIKCD
uniref:Transmembrane 9 superfamily member n=1 Tax=Prymnesium polylepis TaxID=72548 RepID=A0A6T8CVS7_9EUKA|mmetsp:Transcript_42533/g.105936  ORF Transcript_42533/g.105936 Transcript_42533/m.105936 type:complete len:471 (+) Transcript_42533:510-1922(+)